jgi:hypothetical protein
MTSPRCRRFTATALLLVLALLRGGVTTQAQVGGDHDEHAGPFSGYTWFSGGATGQSAPADVTGEDEEASAVRSGHTAVVESTGFDAFATTDRVSLRQRHLLGQSRDSVEHVTAPGAYKIECGVRPCHAL